MDVGRALGQLPAAHARALELWASGRSEGAIAEDLGIAEDAVPALVGVALAKLAGVVRAAVTAPPAAAP